ncbi:uncharacterized protein C15orf39 homolog [Polymixia lowei]
MMSSQPVHSLIDPVAQNKMPLFDGTVPSAGLSKPGSMSGFLSKHTLQYSGAYFTYDPRGKDRADLTPAWSNSKACLLDGRSPVGHLSGMRHNHMLYRPDNKTFSTEESNSHPSSARHTPGRQGFTYYSRSPEMSSPTAATPAAVKKQTAGDMNLSPPSENSVYLAIPKPIYGHGSCCNELGCMLGQRYSMAHGPQRMPSTTYEGEWMHTGAHYNHLTAVQRKAPETLMQQRGLQLEPGTERPPLKDMTVEKYQCLSPSRARTLPTYIDPNYSSYPCAPTHTLFGPLTGQSQRFPTSSKGYHSLLPSHLPTYEHMTSAQHGIPAQIYQDCSPMSKYGQLPQRDVFYYPRANVGVESRSVCKDIGEKHREDVVPDIPKHAFPYPQGHHLVSQPIHGEIPMPSTIASPNHSFLQGFDHPCYAVHRIHLNSSQGSASLKRPHAPLSLHSNGLTTSPSALHLDGTPASQASLYKDQPRASQHVDRSHASPASLNVGCPGSSKHMDQPSVSTANIQMNRVFAPLTSLHKDRSSPSPASLNMDRPLDYSHPKAQVTCAKPSQGYAHSPGALLSRSPTQHRDQIHKAACYSANPPQNTCSPAIVTRKEHRASSSSDTTVCKGNLKRSVSRTPSDHTSPPLKIKRRDIFEMDLCKKQQKIEFDNVGVEDDYSVDSPPMPVIDNVFSLAPYKAYLEASGVLLPTTRPQSTDHSTEPCVIKLQPCIPEKGPKGDGQQPVDCLVPRDDKFKIRPVTLEKPVVEVLEPKKIKVEKMDPQDTDTSVESPVTQWKANGDDCRTIVKEEIKETVSSNDGPMLVIKKYEPDEFESKPLTAFKDENSDESKAGELITDMKGGSSTQGNTPPPPEQTDITNQISSKSVIQPQPPENKPNFQNIPAHCLKLSNYKIVLPNTLRPSPVLTPEKPPVQPIAEVNTKPELQKPVRQHFFELHHSLCKLVFSFVSVSPEQELRTWLSHLELTEPAPLLSTKIQKVSSLLGVKARERWLSEEMMAALQKVLQRLREYIAQEHCPFPHVMRTGTVFIPMLVVKELLFPQVPGGFIDQVLQEHKVELRPTTLSEEKILTQLYKRACSSKLRRLVSLKHLPDIYADVVNLFYHACVCKHLGVELDESAKREPGDSAEETDSSRSPTYSELIADSPAFGSGTRRHLKDQKKKTHLSKHRTTGRVKSSSRRMFLEESTLSEEGEEEECREQAGNGGIVNTLGEKDQSGVTDGGSGHIVAEEDPSLIDPQEDSENSWTRPLTSDEFSSSPSDTETEGTHPSPDVSQSSGSAKPQARSKKHSGMILKLRRVLFSKGLDSRNASYRAVSNSGTVSDPLSLEAENREMEEARERSSEGRFHRRMAPKATHRWQRIESFSHTPRPLISSKRRRRSLIKIKYCPYLSACHSAEHRRRWVLRSAVQRAQRDMKFYYPDLVGKRVRHLYEEDDKSEVWYRGEVMRIHEAHHNPLKTVFEVRYDSEPEWKYYLELLMDYKKGWLKIEE